MSKAAVRKKRKPQAGSKPRIDQRAVDRGVYGTIVLVGGFGLFLWWLVADDTLPHAFVGLVLAILALINFYTWQACRGRHLAAWQRTFAGIPLRFVGFGTRKGKPIDAAHDRDEAKMALYISIAASVIVFLAISWLALPEFRG